MSDEVGAALRELAQRHEVPPRVPPSEIRDRAVRRSRRRRARRALAMTATAACALATIATTLQSDDPDRNGHTPATASDTPTTRRATPRPADSLDLSRHTLTVGDRELRIDAHTVDTLPPDRRLTVTAKRDVMLLPADATARGKYDVKVTYVVELRTADQTPVYAGAVAADTETRAALDRDTGWLGLGTADAEWFYRRARIGDQIEITSTDSPGEHPTGPPEGAGVPSATR